VPSRLKGREVYSRGNNFEVKGRMYVMNITRSPIDNAVWSGYLNTPFEISVVELFSTDVGLRTALFWAITQRISGYSLPTFRDNLSVPSFKGKKSKILDP
jgi:hypothetical protein